MEAASTGLPRRERLRKRASFQAVQGRGRKLHGDHFLVFVLPRPSASSGREAPAAPTPGPSRLGLTVSKKIGGSVVRNRVKRLVREAFRRHKDRFPRGLDIVFIAKRTAADADYQAIEREIVKLCRRHFSR